jgi:hypothetical protein
LAKFEELGYPLVNLTARLYLSLFSHTLPEDASMRVLDLFFLEGMHSDKIIFDVTLGYLRSIESQVLQADDQEQLQNVMSNKNPDFADS